MTNQTFDAVNDLVIKLLPDLLSKLVYEENGKYILYNAYHIIKCNGLYMVYRIRTDEYFDFSSLRNATAWCTLDWFNKIIEAKRVIELDKSMMSVDIDKRNHSRLKNKGTVENRDITKAKLMTDISRQKHFQWELDKYIILARRCQEKGFKNELK